MITPALVFVAGGIVASADVLGWLDPTIGSESVRWIAEATLTIVLFSDASRIDLAALRGEYVVPLRLLAIGLPLTIAVGTLAGFAVFGQLQLIEAVLLGIVLAPTDAALGQAVVTDPRIPSRVRQGLNVESGLNDGICVPCSSSRSQLPRQMSVRSDTALRCALCSRKRATESSEACLRGSRRRSS